MPQISEDALYRAQAFADLAGVTVRTLHHYERLGLLKPKRSAKGYRLYQAKDLERLEQIAALKFLGLPLSQIREVLKDQPCSLKEELARQCDALREKRRRLDIAIAAIEDMQAAVREGKPNTELLRRIIQAISMQNDTSWMMRYYSPAAQAKIAERAASFTPAMQAEISEKWKQYYRDLKALNEEDDPGGAKAAALARRYSELVAAFTGSDPEIEAGLTALYRNRRNWPQELEERLAEYENPAEEAR